MRANNRAIESYGQVKVSTGVSKSNNVELIQMLFDGLIESLATAKGHIQHNNITEKSKAISRASRIVLGLQGALDFDKGGELANNLNELYNYITRRLLHVNARNDLAFGILPNLKTQQRQQNTLNLLFNISIARRNSGATRPANYRRMIMDIETVNQIYDELGDLLESAAIASINERPFYMWKNF